MISFETFKIIVIVWIGIAVVLFPVLMKITVPYGRHSKKGWGPLLNSKTGWYIMEIPAIIVFMAFIISGGKDLSVPVIVFIALWLIHYINRTFIYVSRTKTNDKKMPVIIVIFGFFFNIVNGFINGYWFGYLSTGYPETWLTDWRFIAGAIIFASGMFINQYHDNILLNLRKGNRKGYYIPRGGLFRYVSCPNFLGEILEWGGYALMTWCLPALAFFIWSFANLVPRAKNHHKWYVSHFDNYPVSRKIIFPFIF